MFSKSIILLATVALASFTTVVTAKGENPPPCGAPFCRFASVTISVVSGTPVLVSATLSAVSAGASGPASVTPSVVSATATAVPTPEAVTAITLQA